MIEQQVNDLATIVGLRRACPVLGVARTSYYRWCKPRHVGASDRREPKPQPRALSTSERQLILSTLAEARFCDLSPMEVYAILLDEGTYLGSISTYYRVLRQAAQVRERRRVATHPPMVKPSLIASAPNCVWSWDITCLRGPGEMDVVLSLRHYRHLQPVRGRLDDCTSTNGSYRSRINSRHDDP